MDPTIRPFTYPPHIQSALVRAQKARDETGNPSLMEALNLDPEGQRWLADRANRWAMWCLGLGAAILFLGVPALSAAVDMLGYVAALLKGDGFMWQPSMGRADYERWLLIAAALYPLFAAGALARIYRQGAARQAKIAKWAGVVLAVLILGYIGTALYVLSDKRGLTPAEFERMDRR